MLRLRSTNSPTVARDEPTIAIAPIADSCSAKKELFLNYFPLTSISLSSLSKKVMVKCHSSPGVCEASFPMKDTLNSLQVPESSHAPGTWLYTDGFVKVLSEPVAQGIPGPFGQVVSSYNTQSILSTSGISVKPTQSNGPAPIIYGSGSALAYEFPAGRINICRHYTHQRLYHYHSDHRKLFLHDQYSLPAYSIKTHKEYLNLFTRSNEKNLCFCEYVLCAYI